MPKFKFASVRYCSHLERNVVFENYYNEKGECKCECLNKTLCDFEECGCRNRLYCTSLQMTPKVSSTQSEAVT